MSIVTKESNPELYNSLFEDATIEDAKKNNMSAKEMFEKLGYKQFANNSVEKMYHNNKHTIIFNKLNLEIICTDLIDMKLLQAINKQVEELGWNNE